MENSKSMTVEDRLAAWEKQSGLAVSASEREFIAAMRRSAAAGTGYGWMRQVIAWEWAHNDPRFAPDHDGL